MKRTNYMLRGLLFLAIAASLVILPAAAGAAGNGITSPTDGATVKGTVDVMGIATDANFAKWQLDVLPGESADSAIFVALGTTQFAEAGMLATIDTTKFPDGTHALRLRVVRTDSNYDEYMTKFTIANQGTPAPAAATTATPVATTAPAATTTATPVATTAPAASANGITSPADGATAKGTVEVMGVADSASFSKWQLDVLPGGNANQAIFIALGTQPLASAGMLASIDTTRFPNGEHALRLRVVHADSNYDEYMIKFTIAN